MVDIKRKKGENFDAFLRRFNKRLLQSGVLLQARKIRFKQEEKSKNLQKSSALRKLKTQAKREYLQKTGQLKEDNFRRR